ncbi:hypothetical protein [Streptomyces sp. NPDC055058]
MPAHPSAREVTVVTPWLRAVRTNGAAAALRAGVVLGAGIALGTGTVVPWGAGVMGVMPVGASVAHAHDRAPGAVDGGGRGVRRAGPDPDEGRGPVPHAPAREEGPTYDGPAQHRPAAAPASPSSSPSPSAEPSRAGARPGEGRERPGRRPDPDAPSGTADDDSASPTADEPRASTSPASRQPDGADDREEPPGRRDGTADPEASSGADAEARAPASEAAVPMPSAPTTAAPNALGGPGRPVEPVLRILPLGSGLVLIGLGLGLAFIGLRMRQSAG